MSSMGSLLVLTVLEGYAVLESGACAGDWKHGSLKGSLHLTDMIILDADCIPLC